MEEPRVVPQKKIGEVADDGITVMGNRTTTGQRKRAAKKGHRIAMVDLDVLSRIRLTLMEIAVLTTISRYIPDRGGVEARVTLTEVANDIGVMPQSISRTVSALVERDILIRSEHRHLWYVNPHILYNGDFAEWNDSLSAFIEPRAAR